MNPNKTEKILVEFDRRLTGLCAEMKGRLGAVSVASSLVVHTARFCAMLGPEFDDVAFDKFKQCVKEFRETQAQIAEQGAATNDNHQN
jgi:hypothetical protein